MTDIEIAESIKMQNIVEIAKKIGLCEDDLTLYGKYKVKVAKKIIDDKKGKLILVTAISPTKAGNGKTTVSIGLADALARLNKKVCLALREPSLGPVFGIKGGATGGGYSQIVPMAISTQLQVQTIFYLALLTTIFSRAMNLVLKKSFLKDV